MNTSVIHPQFQYVGSELDVFARAVNWKRYFTAQLRPFIGGDVLEVGAGLGATTRVLCHDGVRSWTGLEPDAHLAERMSEAICHDEISTIAPINVVIGYLDDVPSDTRYGTILYIDVLEHIEHDQAELEKAVERLTPGGHLVVLSPAHQWLFSPFDRAIGHFRRYTRPTLRAISPPDVDLVRLRYLDSVGLLASLANRFALRSSQPTARQIGFWDGTLVPVSRWLDPLLGYRLGKSVIAVWRRKG